MRERDAKRVRSQTVGPTPPPPHPAHLPPRPHLPPPTQASYGHGELQIFNATHMQWGWHQNPDLEPTVADSAWIVKGEDSDDGPVTGVPVFRNKL